MWTENFHIFKLDLEKAEQPEIKFPKSIGSLKEQENSRNTSTFALLTTSKPLTINWKILKRYGNTRPHDLPPDLSVYRLRATVSTGHGTADWFQIKKGVCQGCMLSPYLFNLYAEYISLSARLVEAHAGIKTAGRNINNLRYADYNTQMAES